MQHSSTEVIFFNMSVFFQPVFLPTSGQKWFNAAFHNTAVWAIQSADSLTGWSACWLTSLPSVIETLHEGYDRWTVVIAGLILRISDCTIRVFFWRKLCNSSTTGLIGGWLGCYLWDHIKKKKKRTGCIFNKHFMKLPFKLAHYSIIISVTIPNNATARCSCGPCVGWKFHKICSFDRTSHWWLYCLTCESIGGFILWLQINMDQCHLDNIVLLVWMNQHVFFSKAYTRICAA